VVASNVAVLATDRPAADHVVAEEPATIAVSGAALKAVGAVATGAPVAARAAFLARLAAGRDGSNHEKTNANNELHGQTGVSLDRSPQEDERIGAVGPPLTSNDRAWLERRAYYMFSQLLWAIVADPVAS